MMLEVCCKDCGCEYSLRGWVEKEDLRGTAYEDRMDTITEDELYKLQQEGKIQDEYDKFMIGNAVCPECGSKNVVYF